MARLLICVISWLGYRGLGVEQVLYRYPNRTEPCFSSRLCPEELNRLTHLPTASHKIERSERAKKRLTDWVYLGSTANETVDSLTTSCRLIPDMRDTIEWRRLCRQNRTVREAVTKLLGMIEGETKRLPEKRDMSHLATGT